MTKHTILFLAANPLGTDRLALDEEARAIQEELERSGHRDRFELVTRWAVRPLDLLRELRKLKPTVVHFGGHGGGCGEPAPVACPRRDVVGGAGPVKERHQFALFFQGPDSRPQQVSTAALRETFGAAGSSVKLVVLNACYSEAQAEALLAHVDCVVGMGGAIRDDAARAFAVGFYGALGERQSVAVAYRQGRAAISLERVADGEMPQLKARSGIEVEQFVPAQETPSPPVIVQDIPCPYPGMQPFMERDAGRFFGRDSEIERIVHRLKRGENEIYIIGGSGCGKSSLIAGGLLPRLGQGIDGLPRFHVRYIRPGDRPLDRLEVALGGHIAAPGAAVDALLAFHTPATSVLFVVDQLEELFAIAVEEQRHGFLAAIRALRLDPRCVLLFTLRADFYGAFLNSPLWTDHRGAISRIDLGPLSNENMRAAIVRPAQDVGVHLQTELVSRLLEDADREPGALPLLQETLLQLWGRRRHCMLMLEDYESMADGGQTGLAFAVKEHADAVIDTLTDDQKAIALRILLRLVTFGQGRADTRRQLARDALRSYNEALADFDAVLQRLVDHRLVTITGDHECDVRVDLAHEILIEAWPTFVDAIRLQRAAEQRRRELEWSAAAWRARGSGDGGLLDAVELAGALEWQKKAASHVGYSEDLVEFIAASKRTQVRAIWRRRLAFAGISLLAGMATILLLVAWTKTNDAEHEREVALELRAAKTIAEDRLLEKERADRERESAERASRIAREQTAAVDKELNKAKEDLIKERDTAYENALAAERARRLAEENERRAQKAEKESLDAREDTARANRLLQQALDRERKRTIDLENAIGSRPINDSTHNR